MKTKILMVFASLMMLVFLAGCGKVPQEKIDAANAAIENARIAEADKYIPAEYSALQDQMKAAMANIETEKSKTFKSFDDVTAELDAILASAAQVKENAAATREQMGSEVQSLLEHINIMMAENKDLMTKAPKGKEGTAVLKEIGNEMTVIEDAISEVVALHEHGKFLDAHSKVKAAIENAKSINTELKEAIAKVRR